MQSAKARISESIEKIVNYNQIIGTLAWIKAFQKRFGAAGVAATLREQLKNQRFK